jgi:probable F420-dependent oxidoreductase
VTGDGAARRLSFGVGLPNFGDAVDRLGAREMATAIEDAGFDGVWLTDHVVLPQELTSKYPFSPDGSFFVPEGGAWYEPVALLGYLAAVTTRLQLGIGVCVLPLRDPRMLSQQLAAIDQLSGGRVVLAAGAGWLEEEFDALEVPFRNRGARLEGGIELLRACWTGRPAAGDYGPYRVQQDLLAHPTPAQERLPVLLAGEGERSLRRIVTHGDGWYGAVGANGTIDPAHVARVRSRLHELSAEAGRAPETLTMALRLAFPSRELGSQAVADHLSALVGAGVTDFTVDFGWRGMPDGRAALEALAGTVAAVRVAAEDQIV